MSAPVFAMTDLVLQHQVSRSRSRKSTVEGGLTPWFQPRCKGTDMKGYFLARDSRRLLKSDGLTAELEHSEDGPELTHG